MVTYLKFLSRIPEQWHSTLHHRCIQLLSKTNQQYGCVNASESWSTPGFEVLGLLNIMRMKAGASIYTTGIFNTMLNCANQHNDL